MKKFLLLIFLICQTMPVLAFDFNLVIDDKVKTCQAYTDGYQCNGEEPVYVEGFEDSFIPLHLHESTLLGASNYAKLLGFGDVYKIDDELIYTAKIKKKKKGVLINNQVCKSEENGYTCDELPQNYFNIFIRNIPWNFSFAKNGLGFLPLKITTKDCKGYFQGYQCPNEEPVYIKDFWKHFEPYVSTYDKNVKNLINGMFNCHELKYGYYCPGNLPVINKLYKTTTHRGIFVTNKNSSENKNICRHYTLDEYIDSGYQCKGEAPVITKRPTNVKYTGKYKLHGKIEEMRKGIFTNDDFVTCNQYKDGSVYCPGEENTPKKYAMTYDLTPEEARKAKEEAERNMTATERLRESLKNSNIYIRDNNGQGIKYHVNPYTIDKNTIEFVPRWP